MNFESLTEFLDCLPQKIGVPGFDCAIYHKHKFIYRHMGG